MADGRWREIYTRAGVLTPEAEAEPPDGFSLGAEPLVTPGQVNNIAHYRNE